MLLEELQRLVAAGESENLELKKTTGQRTEAAKTVCALLNGLGGFLLFGVSDRGEITGQQVTAKTLISLLNYVGLNHQHFRKLKLSP